MSDDEEMIDYNPDEYMDYETDDLDMNKKVNMDYELLKQDQLEKKRNAQIEEFQQLSSLTYDEASIVLINYNWNYDILQNNWFENTTNIKIKCGIEQSQESKNELKKFFKKTKLSPNQCLVCECDLTNEDKMGLKCLHNLCQDCFAQYCYTRLDDPLTIISTPCPLKGCNLIVGESIFKQCFKDDKVAYQKYITYLLKNYTDSNSDIKWCPNPKCGICVNVPGHGMKEITCQCGMVFCFKCLKETHRPCDCEMIDMWEKKNSSSSEDAKWLIVNTKQCPKCHRYIEKNQGCNHMTCQKKAGGCGYEFCWICLGEWGPHGSSWYKCTKFDQNKVDKEKEKMKENMKYDLERYVYFYDRYSDHAKSQKYAKHLNERIETFKPILKDEHFIPYLDLNFLDDIVNTVIDSHRMLKNTYIFGFYMKKCKESTLYEYHQDMLDVYTDRLHEMIEQNQIPDLCNIENKEEFDKNWKNFREKALDLQSCIKRFKDNILTEIENNLIGLLDYKKINEDNKISQ